MQGVPSVVQLCGWVGQRLGRVEGMKKDRVEKGRSRGGLWVMLRDETPRGFIEERRREKEKGKKRRKRRERKKEKCRSWLCSNSKEHSRRTLPRFFSFPFSIFLSFSLFQSCETGSAARRKSSRPPPVVVSWGWKTHFLRPFFSFLPVPSCPELLPRWRLLVFSFLLSFRRRWSHRENDSTRFRGTVVWRAFNACAPRPTPPNVYYHKKKLYGGEKPCTWFLVIVPRELATVMTTEHDVASSLPIEILNRFSNHTYDICTM